MNTPEKTTDARKLCQVIEHPVIQHKLTLLRKKETNHADFRAYMEELSALMAYEATRDLVTMLVEIETPLEKSKQPLIGEKVILAAVQRAGFGMLGGMLEMLPFARVGHIGMARDHASRKIEEYYFKIPANCKGQRVLLLDPMLASGDTAVAAITKLKQCEVGPITLVSILAAAAGVIQVKEAHPDVRVITCSLDRELNSKGYILPGLGDAGDRLFDTC